MRYFLIATFVVLVNAVQAQNSKPEFNARDLSVSWQAIQNDYQTKQQSLNALVITNHGHNTLPATGWKLYFNSARGIAQQTVTNNGKIDIINGDLFTLTPDGNFAGIKAGDSTRIDFIGKEPVVNFSDSPDGFYLVWDNQPEKGYPIGNFTIKPFKPNYAGLYTPAVIYQQNKIIQDVPPAQLTKVFPTPVDYKETGGVFTIDDKTNIMADAAFKNEAGYLSAELISLGVKLNSQQSARSINLKMVSNLGDEGYGLSITPQAITINASTSAGIFYGIQSLKTLIPPTAWAVHKKSIVVPCVEVKDEPRFGYRAFLLDVGRDFQTKEQVLKLLDAMALYKLNIFHFHLTDDEGWRIALPSLPELTEISSQRGHTLDSKHYLPPSHGSGPETGKLAGSGYYTRADYIEILKYATERHIAVIPEIESPGHARSAIKAMDARYTRLIAAGKKAEAEKYLLRDLNDQSEYASVQYWKDNVIDVSLPSTYNFVETVIEDVMGLYKEAGAPLKTINFGGDEVPPHVWEKSPAYLTLKASHPEIKNTGDLWYYFYGRVNQLLKAKGLYLSGWEEIGLRKTAIDGVPTYIPNPDFEPEHIQTEVWNNTLGGGQEDLAYKLANGGYKVVLTSVTHLYFDMAHYKSFDEPGYYWGAFIDIDKPFSFIPYDYFKNTTVDKNGLPVNQAIFIGKQRLTDYGKTNILGLQGALWGENIHDANRMEYMIFPSLLGLAERAWAKDPDWATERDTTKSKQEYEQAWTNFVNILGKRELPRLDYYHGGYNYRIPKPGVINQDGKYVANIQFPGLTIRYTTDGKEPNVKSKLYVDGVTNAGSNIKFKAFDSKGRGSNVAEPVE